MALDRRQLLIGGGSTAAVLAGATWFGIHGMGSMSEYNASVAASRAALEENSDLRDLVRYATLAPNGHNTQPWRFRIEADNIDLLADFARRTPVVDPDDHHIYVSLGCAVENLILAAGSTGRTVEMGLAQAHMGAIGLRLKTGKSHDRGLVEAIPHRQSTRGDYDGQSVSTAELRMLASAAEMPEVATVLITDRKRIDQVRNLVLAGNKTQMSDPAFIRELKQWLRFNPHEAMASGDGLFSLSSGSPAVPSWAGPFLFDHLTTAESESTRYASQLGSSAGIAVFVGANADPSHWIKVGQACQRFALQATLLGLKCSFINQPVEVPALRAELASLVGLSGRRPDIVMRFGRGPALPFSARRPLSAVLV